jgi:hypothetical protein
LELVAFPEENDCVFKELVVGTGETSECFCWIPLVPGLFSYCIFLSACCISFVVGGVSIVDWIGRVGISSRIEGS